MTTTFYINMLILALSLFLGSMGAWAVVGMVQDILRRRAFIRALERAMGVKL